MSKRKFSGNISGKGYYIALILCAAAIGITGYLYYRNTNDNTEQMEQPASSAEVEQQDVPAVATQPNGQDALPESTATEPVQPQPAKPRKTVSPVSGATVVPYAVDALAYNQTTRDWRTHNGVDIAAEAGTQVCAAADGQVYSVYEDETMGMTVVVTHDGGYTTRYSSLSAEVCVEPGDTVAAGDPIGYVGCSALLESAIGDHVHFSVTCQGENVDPAEFLEET